jgi:hypothetical protein
MDETYEYITLDGFYVGRCPHCANRQILSISDPDDFPDIPNCLHLCTSCMKEFIVNLLKQSCQSCKHRITCLVIPEATEVTFIEEM